LKHVPAHVAAMSFLVAIALMVLSAVTVSADPGPNNPGNHWGKCCNPGNHYGQISNPGHHYAYGRYKHLPVPPPPSPGPITNPGSHPNGNPAVTLKGAQGNVVGSGGPLTAGETSTLPELPVVLPGQSSPQAQLAASAVGGGGQAWMLLLILPLLLAVWVIVAARLVQRALRGTRAREMAAAPA
jgi:hypothetical protein